MKHNNFDDFLLDPSHDDLDSLHLEAERQLYKKGGLKKLVGKIKNKLTNKKNKKKKSNVSTTDAQAAQIEKVASSNPKGSKSTTATKAPKAPTRKIEVKKTTPKVNAPAAKKIKAKEKSFGETFKENRKMQGAGKTFMYKGKKYSTNTKDDLAKKKKPATKKKTTSALSPNATQRKKLTSKSMFDKIPTGNKMGSGGMKKKMKYKSGGVKPDYLDMDKDGNKKESMKSALRKRRKKGGYNY
tara:strand:- start:4281 stop:5003 length:723 start_codon:yes stop_codon:yes gene_type:complete